MAVAVHAAWENEFSSRVDLDGAGTKAQPNGCDPLAANSDVGAEDVGRRGDCATADDEIMVGHGVELL
jgi:hypothetical protein